jgi:cytoskeletal protein CcmA (bactofilin family)
MTIIGPSLVIRGEVTSDESLTLHGHVRGHIVMRGGTLALGESSRVDGTIRGVRVVVAGAVNGPIQATEQVELQRTAKVDGSLSANQVVLKDGAQFHGGIDMAQRTLARKVAHYREHHSGA